MGLSQIHIGDVTTHYMITGIILLTTMISGNLQELDTGPGVHMVWSQLNSSGRQYTQLLFIVVDGQVSCTLDNDLLENEEMQCCIHFNFLTL